MEPGITPKLNRHARRGNRIWIAAAGLLTLTPLCALGQNAAQRAALASMIHPHPENSQPNGVEATTVPLLAPNGLAFDSAGNLYIADTGDNLIREVTVAGIISTVAGDGEQGFGGDGGPATSALLDSPTGVAVDSNNNIYIADTNNQRIREVSGGTITTIAGTGVAGFSGDGGSALSAQLDLPTAIAVDSKGNLYIADTENNRIREISGGNISTVAGDGEELYSGDGGAATAAGLDSPNGVAVDASFNIYIGDTNNQRIRMVNAGTGQITTIAGNGTASFTGDGTATSNALARPYGVAVDSSGNVYIADTDNNRIRVLSGGIVTTISGDGDQGFAGDTGASINASLNEPHAVAAAGSVQVYSDTGNNRVRQVESSTVNTIAGLAPATAESLVIGGASSTVYGTGTLTATFSNGGLTASGTVTFYDGAGASPAVVGAAALTSNTAVLDTSHLSAGTHLLIASYAGDAKNSAVTSGVYVFNVTPAPLVAVANGVKMLYGQTVPALSGTLTGVLAQDSGNVTADFTTTATATSAPGTYPIGIVLQGSAAANYSVSLGTGTGSVVISQAPSTTALALSTGPLVFGAPVTLTATVASTTSGTPTGTVNFFNGTTELNANPVTLKGGVASLSVSSLPVGAVSLSAVYSGDTDFLASSSSNLGASVISPDFGIGSTPSTQSVLPLQSVNYTLTVTPVNPTFVYPVSLTVSGLPPGVTATLTPSSIAAGASATTITMTLNATATAQMHRSPSPWIPMRSPAALALLLFPLAFTKRMRRAAGRLSIAGHVLLLLVALVAASALTACGGGGFFSHGSGTYTVTVTANNGPDTHATSVTLNVQ